MQMAADRMRKQQQKDGHMVCGNRMARSSPPLPPDKGQKPHW